MTARHYWGIDPDYLRSALRETRDAAAIETTGYVVEREAPRMHTSSDPAPVTPVPAAPLMVSEPAVTVTTITTIVAAIAVLLAQIGLPVSNGLADAISGVVLAIWPIYTVLQIRKRVYAPDTTAALVQEANALGLRNRTVAASVKLSKVVDAGAGIATS